MFAHTEIWVLAMGLFLGFFAQTIVGFAASLVAFPFLLRVYTLQEATAFLSLYYILFSIFMVLKNRRDIDWKIVKTLAPGATIGFVSGIYILKMVDPYILEKVLGVLIIYYVGNELFGKKHIVIPNSLGWLFGLLGGLLGGIISSGSQAFVPYINSRVTSAAVVRATVIGVLAIGNITRLPLMIYTHLLTKQIFYCQIILFPVFLVAVFLGQKMYNRINEKVFKFLLLGFLAVSAFVILIK